ncbi:MAG: hypothetical protein WBG86_09725 [Polyangiales bacterium]
MRESTFEALWSGAKVSQPPQRLQTKAPIGGELMRRTMLLLLVGAAAACGDTTEAAPDLTGIYHLPDRIDAVNLELREDGTFRWMISGCDFFGGSQGVWRGEPGRAVLLPEAGETTFRWIDDVSTVPEREKVELTPGRYEGEMFAVGVTGRDGYDQRWLRGGLCPICDTLLGPSALEPCDAPPFLP